MRVALRLLGNLLRIGLLPLWLFHLRLLRPKARWVEVRLSAHLVEVVGPIAFWERVLRRGQRRGLVSIVELRRLCARIADDSRVDGLVVHVSALESGWATCKSARDAIAALRAKGKRVAVYLARGGGNREFYFALAADRILLAPHAPVALIGVSSQLVYARPLLDRVGVSAEVHARGEYKTAAEALLNAEPSEPQREQLNALIASVQAELERALAERLTAHPSERFESARALFERGIWGAEAALAAGLVDACCYEDELMNLVAGADEAARRPASHSKYLAYRDARLWRRLRPKATLAVVTIHGAITHSERRWPTTRAAALGPVVAALRKAARNPRVAGVLLYVDSPGGSALASDLIHREIVRLREKKPIVAYLGDVAASGGYYIAAPCQRVIAQPTTVTGSIGVLSVRLLGSALIERIGLRAHTLRAAPHADMGSPFRALDSAEEAMLWAETDAIYRAFVEVVARGRGRSPDEIDKLARGRVWSGNDALKRGLVDELGGLERATAALCELVPALRGVSQDDVALRLMSGGGSEPPPSAPSSSAGFGLGELVPWLPSEILLGGIEHAFYYAALPRLN